MKHYDEVSEGCFWTVWVAAMIVTGAVGLATAYIALHFVLKFW